MIYLYKESIPEATVFASNMHYIGSTNAPAPLMTNPTLCLFVKGAAADTTVSLQVAVVPTPVDQSVFPDEEDFINYEAAYVADTIKSIGSLNGCWVRFIVNNTALAAVEVTCMLE